MSSREAGDDRVDAALVGDVAGQRAGALDCDPELGQTRGEDGFGLGLDQGHRVRMHGVDVVEADGSDGPPVGVNFHARGLDGPLHDRVQHAERLEVIESPGVHDDGT